MDSNPRQHPNAPQQNDRADSLREPPYSEDAERALIGSVFLDALVLDEVRDLVRSPEAFYRESHRWIWRALLDLRNSDTSIDQVTVIDWLDARDRLDKAGGHMNVVRLTESVPSAAGAMDYARTVFKHWQARQGIEALRNTLASLYDKGRAPDDVLGQLSSNLDEVVGSADGPHPGAPAVVAEQIQTRFMQRLRGEEADCLPTNIEPIDAVMGGGPRVGEGYVLGAKSGFGKTTTAAAIVGSLMKHHDAVVHWWSTEITEEFTAIRILAAMHGIYENWLRRPQTVKSAKQRAELEAAIPNLAKWWEERDCHVFKHGNPHVDDVRRKARAARARHPDRPLVIVADYIQKFDAGARRRKENVSESSARLQGLALDLDAVTLVLTQFTDGDKNAAREYPLPMPHPGQSRDSGDIEFDASNYLVFHRPYLGDEQYDQLSVLECAKARYGDLGHVLMKGNGSGGFSWWSDAPPEEMPTINTPRIDGYDLGSV